MRHGGNVRRFRLVAAVLVLVGLTESVSSTARTATSGDAMTTIKVGNVAFELVRIPAGRFSMGSVDGRSG